LPEELWQTRHKVIVALLWVHAVAIPTFALARGFRLEHTIAESLIVPATAILATWTALSRRARTAVASAGLLSCSAILVHLSGGVIEMHFHFFVMVAVVSLYQDWIPFLTAIAYVFIHHGLMGALDPDSVFNHQAARDHPWVWAGIHAFFITGISIVCLVSWRLNERVLDERRRAEQRLREETRIVETLNAIGQIVSADLEVDHVVQSVTDTATEVTDARFGAFFYNLVDERGESYTLYSLSGAPREAFEQFGLPRNTEVFAPTFVGEGVVRIDDVTEDSRYGKMAPHYGMPKGHLPVRSYLAVPVRSRRGEVLGGLFFGHPEPGRFTEVHERLVVGIANHAAIAIDNARLYESERDARTASDAAGKRLAVLAEASKVLTSSLEVDAILNGLARLVSPSIWDYCVIDLDDERGASRRVAAVSSEGRTAPPDGERLGAIVAPLVGRDGALGTLTVGTSASKPAEPANVTLAEELARRAAIAVDNARFYARQRTVAETLQHSLLPERLPDLPGMTVAARYLAGGPGVDVGGDWYDLIQTPSGGLALAIGDVVGRGERAASLMGQLRNALRAYALDGKSPSEIMTLLNALLFLEAGDERMATVICIVLDIETGELCYSNAGHPPAMIASREGTVRLLEEHGAPVGVLPSARYGEHVAVLAPGETLVLYTDGLVEDKHTPLDDGLERLATAIGGAPNELDALCEHVMVETIGTRDTSDDAALIALRLEPLPAHLQLHLPADPRVLPPLRATLRRWLTAAGANEQECYELLVAACEACTNAIRHSGGPRRGKFEFEAQLNGDLSMAVRSRGPWRKPSSREGGRGLTIIEAYVDHLDIDRSDRGVEVRMQRRLDALVSGAERG
jgi:GAF domain-containing protein/anti-sigma regulatory factor (Ser/Thr protein kinase)